MEEEVSTCSVNTDADYYAILGCDESSSKEQIIAEYRLRALRLHPDKTSDGHAQFAVLSRAKEVLIDAEKRKAYDAWRRCRGFMSFEEWLMRKDFIAMTTHWRAPNSQAMIANSQDFKYSESLQWEPDNSAISIMFRKRLI
uniref:J domain-containing protein n=1 Tax=Trichuris muris TaxID=70415 RepID=A0A5S6R314_TRIMR